MAFESYQLAFDTLKTQSGLLYFHPQKSITKLPVTLIDKLGIAHKVDLSKVGFVLQKKALLAYAYLDTCAEKEAKEAIFSLVALLKHKMDLGIADRDPLIRTNFGFLEGSPMQIDIGPLFFDPSMKKLDKQKEEIPRITLSLKHWLEKNHPEMLPYLDEALKNL